MSQLFWPTYLPSNKAESLSEEDRDTVFELSRICAIQTYENTKPFWRDLSDNRKDNYSIDLIKRIVENQTIVREGIEWLQSAASPFTQEEAFEFIRRLQTYLQMVERELPGLLELFQLRIVS